MALYHVNELGEARECSAKQGRCPFGGLEDHYTTKTAALRAFSLSQSTFTNLSKGGKVDGRKLHKSWPDLNLYRDRIGNMDKVFVHPQGKIAIVHPDETMTVMKNGKPAGTGATAAQLEGGRGGWKKVKEFGKGLMDGKTYNANFPRMDEARLYLQLDPKEKARLEANKKAGYPSCSKLDASAKDKIAFREDKIFKNVWGESTPMPIVPLGKTGNPHRDLDDTQGNRVVGLCFWNNSQGKSNSTFEVWKDLSSGRYRAVRTHGFTVNELGSKVTFSHDQTGRASGHVMELVGAFVPEEGGAAVGEIPDRKLPLYVYK